MIKIKDYWIKSQSLNVALYKTNQKGVEFHCHKLWCLNVYIFATRRRLTLIVQPMKSVRSNSWKYQRLIPLPGCKDIGMIIFELVARTQFFSLILSPTFALIWRLLLVRRLYCPMFVPVDVCTIVWRLSWSDFCTDRRL